MRKKFRTQFKQIKFNSIFLILILISLPVLAESNTLVLLDENGVIIQGYDPVAYFADNKAVKGDSKYQSTYEGAIYYFASSENKAAFDNNPEKYKPQFGGYCAMAVRKGELEEIDANNFVIQDGRLLMQRNEKAHKMFLTNPEENLKIADENWPKLVEKHGI